MALNIESRSEGNVIRIALAGELDGVTAPTLRDTVDRLLSAKPAELILDVENLSFMASAGLRIIIFAKQKMPTLKIYVLKPQPAIVETLRKTGFYDGVYVVDAEPASGKA